MELIQRFSKEREGNDEVTQALPTKLRQQIYYVLGNRGFANIPGGNENQFIKNLENNLRILMEGIRTVEDPRKENRYNKMAPDIIRDILRIFFFRLKVEEPMADELKWFSHKAPVDPDSMEGIFDNDIYQNFEVKLCYFPAIGYNLDNVEKQKIFIKSKVCVEQKETIYH